MLTHIGKEKLKILLQFAFAFITIIGSENILQPERISKYSCNFDLLFNSSSFKLKVSLVSLREKNLISFKNSLSVYEFLLIIVLSFVFSFPSKKVVKYFSGL